MTDLYSYSSEAALVFIGFLMGVALASGAWFSRSNLLLDEQCEQWRGPHGVMIDGECRKLEAEE